MWYIGFLLLFGLFHYGTAITCYECNSATNSQCWNPSAIPNNLKRNCSEHDRGGVNHTFCRKIMQSVDFEVNGQVPVNRIIRSCGWDDSKYKNMCYQRAGYGGRQEVCSCNKDLCNGTKETTILAPYILIVGLLLISANKF